MIYAQNSRIHCWCDFHSRIDLSNKAKYCLIFKIIINIFKVKKLIIWISCRIQKIILNKLLKIMRLFVVYLKIILLMISYNRLYNSDMLKNDLSNQSPLLFKKNLAATEFYCIFYQIILLMHKVVKESQATQKEDITS